MRDGNTQSTLLYTAVIVALKSDDLYSLWLPRLPIACSWGIGKTKFSYVFMRDTHKLTQARNVLSEVECEVESKPHWMIAKGWVQEIAFRMISVIVVVCEGKKKLSNFVSAFRLVTGLSRALPNYSFHFMLYSFILILTADCDYWSVCQSVAQLSGIVAFRDFYG